jgi:hypothetical protein
MPYKQYPGSCEVLADMVMNLWAQKILGYASVAA